MNGGGKVSALDGAAPDSTGMLQCAHPCPFCDPAEWLLLTYCAALGADFSNYFCTYAFLYHQVGLLLFSALSASGGPETLKSAACR